MMKRRSFLAGILGATVAPAIITTPGILMPVRRLHTFNNLRTSPGTIALLPTENGYASFVSADKAWIPADGRLVRKADFPGLAAALHLDTSFSRIPPFFKVPTGLNSPVGFVGALKC